LELQLIVEFAVGIATDKGSNKAPSSKLTLSGNLYRK